MIGHQYTLPIAVYAIVWMTYLIDGLRFEEAKVFFCEVTKTESGVSAKFSVSRAMLNYHDVGKLRSGAGR